MKTVIYNDKKATRHHRLGVTLSPGENVLPDNIADQLINSGLVVEKKLVKNYEDKSMDNESKDSLFTKKHAKKKYD